jgi:hypothetical protein
MVTLAQVLDKALMIAGDCAFSVSSTRTTHSNSATSSAVSLPIQTTEEDVSVDGTISGTTSTDSPTTSTGSADDNRKF